MIDLNITHLAIILSRLSDDNFARRDAAGKLAMSLLREAGLKWKDVLSSQTLSPHGELRKAPQGVVPQRRSSIPAGQAKSWLRILNENPKLSEAEQKFVWATHMRLTSEHGVQPTEIEQGLLWAIYWRNVLAESYAASGQPYRDRTRRPRIFH